MTSGRWSRWRVPESGLCRRRSRLCRVLAVALCCLVAAVVLASLAGAGSASLPDGQFAHNGSTDDQPPTLVNGTRLNDTAVRLHLADNHDVDESSIQREDFAVETGAIRNISVTELGSNASVVLVLDGPVDEENLTVGRAQAEVVEDTNGNALGEVGSDDTVVVRDMDSVPPNIVSFSVSEATGGPATVRVRAESPLARFNVTVAGAVSDSLDRSDFERVGTGATYETTYRPASDGYVRFTLYDYADRAGNVGRFEYTERVRVDLTPPTAVAGLDLSASRNLTLVFDGGRSADANGIAAYDWAFGDGTTASGERVTHSYLPGNYTARLTVTDAYGNTATDTLVLNLTGGAGDLNGLNVSELRARLGAGESAVSVARPDGTVSDEAVVTVERTRAGARLAIGAVDDNDTGVSATGLPLARSGTVTLDGLTVVPRTNRSFTLGLSMAGPAAVDDAATPTGAEPLAALTVVDSLPDGAIAGVNISVSVAASRLGALDASPESVSLLRRHNGTWRSLPTTVLNETNGTFRFHARSPGFSRFAVVANGPADGGSAGDTPGIDDGVGSNLAVTDASLVQTNVSAGTELGVNVTVANRGNASGSYTAGLALNGSVVATADSPAVAANESATFRVSYAADPGTYAVSVNGTAAGTVTVVPGASDGSSAGDAPPVTVTNVTVGQSTLAPGETLTVNVTVRNDDDRPRVYTAGLALNGGVVATASSPPIPAGESRTFSLLHTVNRTGQFSVAVNRTTGGTITVEESGGLLASVLGLVGFLPMGLVRPLAMFVLLPLAVIYGVLKALAIYLGY